MAACGDVGSSESSSDAPAARPSASADGTLRVTVNVGNAERFQPSSIVVRAGQPVELTLRNEGRIQHDFTLTDGVVQPVKVVASGGQTASATFTLDQPGTYMFICSVSGHVSAGMKGTITAE